jgi:hypothetical protein
VGVAWHGAVKNVFRYQGIRVGEWSLHELAANHSVFGLAKLMAVAVGLPLARLTLPYYACGAALMGWVFFARLWRMPMANQLLALTAFMVALPPISYFYALVHLYAAWVVLVFVAIRAEKVGSAGKGVADGDGAAGGAVCVVHAVYISAGGVVWRVGAGFCWWGCGCALWSFRLARLPVRAERA